VPDPCRLGPATGFNRIQACECPGVLPQSDDGWVLLAPIWPRTRASVPSPKPRAVRYRPGAAPWTSVPSTDAAFVSRDAKESECRAEVSAVEAVWVMQTELNEQERLRAMEIFGERIQHAGMDSSEAASFDELIGITIDEYDGLESPESPTARKLRACLTEIESALTTSLPGLRERLAQLDTGTWRLE